MYANKQTVMIFIFAYFFSFYESIVPREEVSEIGYKLWENGKITKSGMIAVPGNILSMKNVWRSTKKFTWCYLDCYRQQCAEQNQYFMEKIIYVL